MTGADRSAPPPHPAGEDLRDLARDLAEDWMTVWQSELSTLAVDREVRESWHLMASLWADAASAMLQGAAMLTPAPDAPHDPAGRGFGAAGTAAPPRPPAPAPAPDPRDAEIEHLREQVTGLEERLARLERRRR
jgi:hypothetical protein